MFATRDNVKTQDALLDYNFMNVKLTYAEIFRAGSPSGLPAYVFTKPQYPIIGEE